MVNEIKTFDIYALADKLSRMEVWGLYFAGRGGKRSHHPIKEFPLLTGLTKGCKLTTMYKELNEIPVNKTDGSFILFTAPIHSVDEDWSTISFHRVDHKTFKVVEI